MNRYILYFFSLIFIIIGVYFSLTKYATAADCTDSNYASINETYCREQLVKLLTEEADAVALLKTVNKTSSNYESEVKRLTTEINALKIKVKARANSIALLKNDINTKVSKIETLQEKISTEKESLAQLIRKEREIDNISIVSLILSQDNISDVYGDIDSFNSIKEAIQKSVEEITGVKILTETEKKSLEDKKNQETNAKYELENTQKKTTQVEANQKILLAGSINQAAALAKLAAEKKAQAEKIRTALIKFQGSGISSKSISFGEAYDYAKNASGKTGVRPALILAIMQQETGFGSSFGGCYITDITTGDGKGIQSGAFYEKVMGIGSLSIFKRITEDLGFNWNTTPISCPIDMKRHGTATKYYDGRGYGGAMGYTQFIPSTWVLVEKRVETYLSIKIANPWNPQHAVMATAIFLQDLGASSQTYTSEYNSACKYFGSCSSYASSVMKKATNIQLDINKLESI